MRAYCVVCVLCIVDSIRMFSQRRMRECTTFPLIMKCDLTWNMLRKYSFSSVYRVYSSIAWNGVYLLAEYVDVHNSVWTGRMCVCFLVCCSCALCLYSIFMEWAELKQVYGVGLCHHFKKIYQKKNYSEFQWFQFVSYSTLNVYFCLYISIYGSKWFLWMGIIFKYVAERKFLKNLWFFVTWVWTVEC